MDYNSIEFWENEYLNQIEYLLQIDYEKMMEGFASKEYIKDNWKSYLGKETSDFAVGAERIFYWLFNQFGQPNSSPIGSDLFFETYNAYIHIDIKTVTLKNIGDYSKSIFIGNNQTSYECDIIKKTGNDEHYKPHLPNFYIKKVPDRPDERKVCLTYLITILYDENNLDIYNLAVMSIPNGELKELYGNEILSAGKNQGKARFKFSKCIYFKTLSNVKRIRAIRHERTLNEKYSGMTQIQYENRMKIWCEICNQ